MENMRNLLQKEVEYIMDEATMKLFILFNSTPKITSDEAVNNNAGDFNTALDKNILRGIMIPSTTSIMNITL